MVSVKVEVWGDYACFTRAEMKTNRVSYDVITPSAARGILEAIYWHPGLCYHINKIYVLSPIRTMNVKRNEVQSKISASLLRTSVMKDQNLPFIDASKDIIQRTSLILRDVHYVIEAHFSMTDKASEKDNCGKFQDIIKRRLHKGQCFYQPYLGCKEFSADFKEWEGGKIPTIEETKELGYMFWDFDYSNMPNIQPQFFRARMENGVINLKDCEVVN